MKWVKAKNQILVAALLAVFCLALSRPLAAAPEGINLQISPVPITLSTEPGKPITTDLRVRNAGTSPEQLKVTLKKFRATESGDVDIDDPVSSDEYIKWVSFNTTNFNAPPNEWQTIKMTINPPTSAAYGYYYAVQFARAKAVKAAPGQTAIEGAVAIFILLDVKAPGAKRDAQLVEFKADKQLYEFLPSTLTVKVRNTGNTHLVPKGNIFISRGSSRASQLVINEPGGSVLPRSVRSFAVNWDDAFPVYVTPTEADGNPAKDSKGQVIKQLKWDLTQVPKLRIGKYTAKVVMVYDDGTRDIPLEGTVSFWVIPWRLILGMIAVPVVPAILVYALMRRRFAKLRRRGQL